MVTIPVTFSLSVKQAFEPTRSLVESVLTLQYESRAVA